VRDDFSLADFLKLSIFFCIGWLAFAVAFGLDQGWRWQFDQRAINLFFFRTSLPKLIMVISWVFAGLPLFLSSWASIGGGSSGGTPFTVTTTTWSDGSTTRETSGGGGSGGSLAWEILKAIWASIIATLKTILIVFGLSISFFKMYTVLSLINLIIIIGSPFIVGIINWSGTAAHYDDLRKFHQSDFINTLNETNNGIVISEYIGKKQSGAILIPAEIKNMPVTRIEGKPVFDESHWGVFEDILAFIFRYRISSVTLPDTITYIDNFMLQCKMIKQISLPENLIFIGNNAFTGSGIKSVVIPEGVTDIGNNAFSNCTKLTSVTLPKSLKRIGVNAFGNCESLVEIIVPEGSKIAYGTYSKENIFKQEEVDSFNRCLKLSDASMQAVRDTGYTGEFSRTAVTSQRIKPSEYPTHASPYVSFFVIPKGNTVSLTGQTDNGWSEIIYKRKKGWVETYLLGEPVAVTGNVIKLRNGSLYEGDLVNGKPHGKGKIISKSSDIYEGDFVNGKRHGKGKYTWVNGEVYEGDFVNDKRHGKGKYTWASGGVYEGEWVKSKQEGRGKYTAPDGKVREGIFKNGKFLRELR